MPETQHPPLRPSTTKKKKKKNHLLRVWMHGEHQRSYLGTRCCRCSSAQTCPHRMPLHSEVSGSCRCASVSARLGRSARYRETSPSTTTSPHSLVRKNRGKMVRGLSFIWSLFNSGDGIIKPSLQRWSTACGRESLICRPKRRQMTDSFARSQQEMQPCSLNDWRASTSGCQDWLDEFLKHLPGKRKVIIEVKSRQIWQICFSCPGCETSRKDF